MLITATFLTEISFNFLKLNISTLSAQCWSFWQSPLETGYLSYALPWRLYLDDSNPEARACLRPGLTPMGQQTVWATLYCNRTHRPAIFMTVKDFHPHKTCTRRALHPKLKIWSLNFPGISNCHPSRAGSGCIIISRMGCYTKSMSILNYYVNTEYAVSVATSVLF